jgi:hypothetical protein
MDRFRVHRGSPSRLASAATHLCVVAGPSTNEAFYIASLGEVISLEPLKTVVEAASPAVFDARRASAS